MSGSKQTSKGVKGFFAFTTVALIAVVIIVATLWMHGLVENTAGTETDSVNSNTTTVEITHSVDTVKKDPEPSEPAPSPEAVAPAAGIETNTAGFHTFADEGSPLPVISDEKRVRIENAIAAIETGGKASIVLYCPQDGNGLAYHPQDTVYAASTCKVLLIYYILTSAPGAGGERWTEEAPDDNAENGAAADAENALNTGVFETYAYDFDDGWGYGSYYYDYPRPDISWGDAANRFEPWVLADIENVILYSDNDAFDELCFTYYTSEYIEWLAQYGIEHDFASENGPYPDASAESMSWFWGEFAAYLDQDDDAARAVSELLRNTEVSFIRDAFTDEEGFVSADVRNKAGWIAEESYEDDVAEYYYYGVNSTSDCGIIEKDGKRYILAVMTEQPFSDAAASDVSALVEALFS